MALSVNGILYDELTTDPTSPAEGQTWFNTTSHLFKIYRNGATTSFVDAEALSAHTGSTSNPHATTLDQARAAGATLAGAVNFGGYALGNVGAGSLGTDGAQRQWVLDQIKAYLAGLAWQAPVIQFQNTPPGGPNDGDRYVVTATGTGAWTGKENQIAQWSTAGSAWVFEVPTEGFALRNLTANTLLIFDGSAWGNFGNAVDHNSLLNLTIGDFHTQYQLRSEKNQNNGYAGLTAGGTIDDTRHGNRGGGSLHALASTGGHGFMPQSVFNKTVNPAAGDDSSAGWVPGSVWVNVTGQTVWVCISNSVGVAVWKEITNTGTILQNKAGVVLAASFAGNPKKATVTFATPFADANYALSVTCITSNSATYSPAIESQLAGSFVINIGANNIGNLVQADWHATKNGEST
jgi:hypothetical protein